MLVLSAYVNREGSDQPVHSHNLASAFTAYIQSRDADKHWLKCNTLVPLDSCAPMVTRFLTLCLLGNCFVLFEVLRPNQQLWSFQDSLGNCAGFFVIR